MEVQEHRSRQHLGYGRFLVDRYPSWLVGVPIQGRPVRNLCQNPPRLLAGLAHHGKSTESGRLERSELSHALW